MYKEHQHISQHTADPCIWFAGLFLQLIEICIPVPIISCSKLSLLDTILSDNYYNLFRKDSERGQTIEFFLLTQTLSMIALYCILLKVITQLCCYNYEQKA